MHHIVLISGPPASGKTTIARPLAEALGFALITKDEIKESLFTSLNGAPNDLAVSRHIGSAAMDLLWALAPHCPQLVLEANFRTRSPFERMQLAALLHRPGARLVEIHCRIPLEEAARRFAQRARDERHHPAHALKEMSLDQLAEYSDPFALSPVITVDSTAPLDLPALVKQTRTLLAV
ncbi:MAG TPA: AAA family ATPase [Acidobacteriaceae bacterium]|nr:AAA family ATPase [Acidobacteriaceae bacterium]